MSEMGAETSEICNMCGRSVAWGSGWYVNRVPDLNSPEERATMGRPYPQGEWVCAECDAWCDECREERSQDT